MSGDLDDLRSGFVSSAALGDRKAILAQTREMHLDRPANVLARFLECGTSGDTTRKVRAIG